MSKLSITSAWNETASFVKREGHLLFPLAFLLLALPMALLQLIMPQTQQAGLPPFGAWVLVFILAMIASMVGNIALSVLALRPGISVGEALGRGLRRFLSLLGAGILAGLVGGVIFFAAALIAALLVPGASSGIAAGSQADPAVAAATGLTILFALPFVLFFAVRLLLMTAVAAGEEGGPVAIIRRSWRLTSGHFWRLLGFLILILILFGVISLAITAVVGLLVLAVAGPPEPGNMAMFIMVLVGAVVNTVFSLLLVTLIARIYAQLSAGEPRVSPEA